MAHGIDHTPTAQVKSILCHNGANFLVPIFSGKQPCSDLTGLQLFTCAMPKCPKRSCKKSSLFISTGNMMAFPWLRVLWISKFLLLVISKGNLNFCKAKIATFDCCSLLKHTVFRIESSRKEHLVCNKSIILGKSKIAWQIEI